MKFATVFHRGLDGTQRSPLQRGEQKGRCNFLLSFTAVQNWHCASHKRTSSASRQHSAGFCFINLCSQTEIWFSKIPNYHGLIRHACCWQLFTCGSDLFGWCQYPQVMSVDQPTWPGMIYSIEMKGRESLWRLWFVLPVSQYGCWSPGLLWFLSLWALYIVAYLYV